MLLKITNILLLIFIICASAFAQDFVLPQAGEWSTKSIQLWPENFTVDQKPDGVVFKSLGGQYTFTITYKDYSEVKLTDIANKKVIGTFGLLNLRLSEILWSPDERSFAITQSDGGWVGTWILSIGQISENGTLRFLDDIAKIALADFRKNILSKDCADEDPNMAAVTWVDPNKLLIVGEVPPHSSCKMMGAFFGYIVEIPSGKIVNRIDELTLRKEWKSNLGKRLVKK